MASAKLPPRQKMIGMMYLVLTALLALNVSKEILNSFVVVNGGLETTGKNLTHNTTQLYGEFDRLKLYDPKRVSGNWEKAQKARAMAKEMGTYLLNLKHRLIRETSSFKKGEEDTIHLGFVESMDDINTATHIMCGNTEDASDGVARELKNKLNNYQSAMLALLDPDDQKNVHFSIDTKNPPRTDDESSKNWELNNFYHTPLAAAVTILSKFETDIKDAESEVVDRLLAKSSGETIPFDTVTAKVVAESNYVLLGEKYKADVFIAAYNKTLKTDVLSGDYDVATHKFNGKPDSVRVEKGMGKYVADASSEGFKTMKGVIRMVTPKGKVFEYPYESEYIVAKPALTVSATKMNVIYAGLPNPVSVSVPGIASDKLSVSCDNGTLRATGKGEYEVTNAKPGKCHITAVAEIEGGQKKPMGTLEFRVLQLPTPRAKIGELSTDGKMKKEMLSVMPGMACYYENFVFNAQAVVKSFDFVYKSGNLIETIPVTGYAFTDKIKIIIKNLKRGDLVTFENIKAIGADHEVRSLSPISIHLQ